MYHVLFNMPLDTVLCVDTSGSMAGRGMRELKEACRIFIEGVQETERQTGLSENVAIVEFGNEVRLVAPLSHDYPSVSRAVDTLAAGGRTPMRLGLVKAMEEILQRGGIVTIRNGQRITPRVILMTDGIPTDKRGETSEAREAVLKQALAFGMRWKECGLPHAVPIACVGCGDCEPELMEKIANSTNGMFVIVDDVTKLSTFFRRQVLLTRYALQSQSRAAISNQEALRSFFTSLGEAVEEAELDGLFRLLLGMMVLDKLAEEASKGKDHVLPGLPAHGSRVTRGKDWKWGDQDENGQGTIVAHDRPGVVRVLWDKSNKSNVYRYGAEDAYDVGVIAGEVPRVLFNDERGDGHRLKAGVEVIRGPDWQWDNQDGGVGNTGIVYDVDEAERCVYVRWMSGVRGKYRNGKTGCYDVVITPRSAGQIGGGVAFGPPGRHAQALQPAAANIRKAEPAAVAREGGGPSCGAMRLPVEACGAVVEKLTADCFIGMGIDKQTWQWQDEDDSWHLFPDKQCIVLEESLEQKVVILVTEGVRYTVDMEKMVKTSESDGKRCKIRRSALSNTDRELAEAMERSLYLM